MSIHTEPVRRYHEVPSVTEIALLPLDHNDPLFMGVHVAADDAMVEALTEDLEVDLMLQDLCDEDDNHMQYGG